MQLISINIGHAHIIRNAKASGTTGIYKSPVDGPVEITALGLAGDVICDSANHGGVDQAVYVYGTSDYAWWSAELERDLAPGTFGENLTISELESARLYIGDRLHVGSIVLEVTAPRIPCATLAARMGDPTFVKRFRYAERPGLYCRVMQEGIARVGDRVRLERYAGETISAIEMFRDYYAADLDEVKIRRQLAAPIAVRARADLIEQLEKVRAKL
jgi:MOSC domain-containing protein YiiM